MLLLSSARRMFLQSLDLQIFGSSGAIGRDPPRSYNGLTSDLVYNSEEATQDIMSNNSSR
jgi:hypothetical protein